MTNINIEKEIEEAKKNGAYEMNLELIDSLKDLESVLDNEKVRNLNEYCLELYKEYNEDAYLKTSDSVRISYLDRLKIDEVIKNQKMEKEDPFVTSVFMNLQDEFGIDIALNTDNYDRESILKIYNKLIKYTSADTDKELGFRDNNQKFVGTIFNGQRQIQYFPVDYKKIPAVVDAICTFINTDTFTSDEYTFIKPIIVHGLITAFQPFNDGNSRLARVVMHDLIYKLSKNNGLTHHEGPSIYTSKQSMGFRDDYRVLIKDLVLNHDIDAWIKWIIFNLKNIETSLELDRVKLGKIITFENKKGYKM